MLTNIGFKVLRCQFEDVMEGANEVVSSGRRKCEGRMGDLKKRKKKGNVRRQRLHVCRWRRFDPTSEFRRVQRFPRKLPLSIGNRHSNRIAP